jgi:hypothetical protein
VSYTLLEDGLQEVIVPLKKPLVELVLLDTFNATVVEPTAVTVPEVDAEGQEVKLVMYTVSPTATVCPEATVMVIGPAKGPGADHAVEDNAVGGYEQDIIFCGSQTDPL